MDLTIVLIQAIGLVVQGVAVAVSVIYASRAVKASNEARREESQRFERAQRIEREAHKIEEQRGITADLERRLVAVLDRVVQVDELTVAGLDPTSDSLTRIGLAKRRLRAAIKSAGRPLPKTMQLISNETFFPSQEQVNEAYAEIEKSLEIFSMGARLPFLRNER